MSVLSERKKAELDAKQASLQKDFDYWMELLSKEMGLHTSQLHCLLGKEAGVLSGLCKTLWEAPLDFTAMPPDRLLAHVRAREETLLAAHCLWAFFREKLAQRLDKSTRPFLNAADELAWKCYRPAMDAAGARYVPPLVFLNGGLSPFIMPRGVHWNAEGVPGDLLSDAAFAEVLRSLPVPVIGVPYVQVTHLPDLIFVAHETGHAVEADFHLTDEIVAAVSHGLAGHPRLARWTGWLGECFADAWAVANTGPAFVSALQDFLASDHEKVGDAKYPPVWLRVQVGRAFVKGIGFPEAADHLLAQWRDVQPRTGSAENDDEVHRVTDALLNTPFKALNGETVRGLGGYNQSRHDLVLEAARQAKAGNPIEGDDPRLFIAALRRCYEENPSAFDRPVMKSKDSDEVLRASLSARFRDRLQSTDTKRAVVEWNDPGLYSQLAEILKRHIRGGAT